MRRYGTVVLVVLGALLAGCTPGGSAKPWVGHMLDELNLYRTAAGAPPLQLCTTLMSAAQGHSDDQAVNNTMTHTGSNGSDIGTRADAAGYTNWTALGENVAMGYSTVDTVMAAWMASTGHRANILNPAYRDVGLAESFASDGTPYWTQDFGVGGVC
jgi:uncharacterized protein YkwD